MSDTFPGADLATREPAMARPIRPPIANYPTPAAVLADGRLSRAERLRVLDAWVQAIIDRDIAARESAGAVAQPVCGHADDALLREVTEAITVVESSEPPAPAFSLARLWQRLKRPGQD